VKPFLAGGVPDSNFDGGAVDADPLRGKDGGLRGQLAIVEVAAGPARQQGRLAHPPCGSGVDGSLYSSVVGAAAPVSESIAPAMHV